MSSIEHSLPAGPSDAHVRVLFELENRKLGDAEALWAERVGAGTVRLDNIPMLIFGVSMGDVVSVTSSEDALMFAGVADRGGHSTYRVMLEDADDALTQDRFREIVTLGCAHERLTPRFIAIDVPPDVDVFKVYDLLERGLQDGTWTFEEGHCGHPVDAT